MKENKKKSKASPQDTEEEYAKIIEDLAAIVAQGMKEEKRNAIEPFEFYTAKIKAKIQANLGEFKNRFAKGYQVLLKEIEKEFPDKNIKDKGIEP